MARLYVLSGPDLGKTFDVGPGATLGRSTDCAAVLRDHSVSRQHARLECHDGRWTVVDLGSRNGVIVGGAKTPRAALADGDEFQLGEVLMRFRSGASEAPTLPPPAAPPKPAPEPAPAVEEEIVLEGAWEAPAPAPPPAPAPAQRPQPAFPKSASPAPELVRTARTPAPPRGLEQRERGILQYSKVEPQGGFFQTELSQQPWYVKLGIALLALALFALVGWAAFHATSFFKQKVAGAAVESAPGADR
jgi:predicted component of type VI protein secretion system